MLLLIAGIGQLIGCIVNLIAIAWIVDDDNQGITALGWVVAVLALLCSLGAGKHMHTFYIYM